MRPLFRGNGRKVFGSDEKKIDADVYAICEIEEGDYSVNELVQALNEEYGVTGKYKGIDSGDKKITSYTKNAFIYDTERVSPYMDLKLMKAHIWFFVMWHNALS